MKEHSIKAIITIDGLYSKWVGAELISAIDNYDKSKVAVLLRSRKTLTTTVYPGKENKMDYTEIFVDALTEDGREPMVIFRVSNDLWDDSNDETDNDTLKRLADLIMNHYYTTGLIFDDEVYGEDVEEDVSDESPKDKKSTAN